MYALAQTDCMYCEMVGAERHNAKESHMSGADLGLISTICFCFCFPATRSRSATVSSPASLSLRALPLSLRAFVAHREQPLQIRDPLELKPAPAPELKARHLDRILQKPDDHQTQRRRSQFRDPVRAQPDVHGDEGEDGGGAWVEGKVR